MQETDVIEKRFLSALQKSTNPLHRVLLGVSGGADSMAMLSLCIEHLKRLSIPFSVMTVNHNIRSEEESASDVLFVSSFCAEHDVAFIEKKVDQGTINALAQKRKKGLEEAARFIRYSFFEEVAGELGASHIFLAHTKNDQIETLLQRFLQGSISVSGIAMERIPYFRPLLEIDRAEIEAYLQKKGISFCTDKTNADNSYFRNRLRNEVIPFLTAEVPGWQQGILNGAKKALYDADFFDMQLRNIWTKEGENSVSTDAEVFLSFHMALRIRYIYKALIALEIDQRVPYAVIETASEGKRCETGQVSFYKKGKKLCAKKVCTTGKYEQFFGIIEKECSIVLDDGILNVSIAEGKRIRTNASCITSLPFMVQIDQKSLKIEQLYGVPQGQPVNVEFIRNNDE